VEQFDLSPLLMVVSGAPQGASFRLRAGLRVIGRAEGADILVMDGRASRRHATVEVSGGRALLRDLESTNGTWLNGRRVSGTAPLCDGDRIGVGGVELRFFDPASAPTDPVGTLRPVPPARSPIMPPARPVRRATAGGLRVPTQAMATHSPHRLLLMIGRCFALAGWMAWAYLVLG
jgi:predicted component of type VI protein secretion system